MESCSSAAGMNTWVSPLARPSRAGEAEEEEDDGEGEEEEEERRIGGEGGAEQGHI